MFTTPTVFILGAGASWHYGYPTGEGLVNKIIKKAELASTYFEYSMKAQSQELPEYIIKEINQSLSLEEQWKTAFELCNELKRGLETVKPLVIDYYLGWNEHLQSIGRLLIAWVIFECEKNYSELKGNINRRELLESSLFGQDHQRAKDCDVTKYDDDWYRFVLHKLAINCKSSNDLLKKNDVRFITFNYDVSLEIALSQGLKHIKQFTPEDVDKFLWNDRIRHIYGRVRKIPPIEMPHLNWVDQHVDLNKLGSGAHQQYQRTYREFLDGIYSASLEIRVIDPKDKKANEDVIAAAAEDIKHAKLVYILGYGFDENNSGRLELSESLYHQILTEKIFVFFTNFQDHNRVKKRASGLFLRNTEGFQLTQIETRAKGVYEMSVRNVYDALALDFESLEQNEKGNQ